MGSSGAGKTTLLDVLAGRKTGGTITGDIRLNGHPKLQETFNRQVKSMQLVLPGTPAFRLLSDMNGRVDS